MTTELALHAYVFFGNALNLMVNRAGAPQRAALGASPETLAALYAKIEPMTPRDILHDVAELSPEQRRLLLDVCSWCLEHLHQDLEASAGVSRPEAEEVIGWLEQSIGGG